MITRIKLDLHKTHLMCISFSLCVSTAKIYTGTPAKNHNYRQSRNMRQSFQACQTEDSYINNFEQTKSIPLFRLLTLNIFSAVLNNSIQLYRIFNFQVLLTLLRKCIGLMKNIAQLSKNYY